MWEEESDKPLRRLMDPKTKRKPRQLSLDERLQILEEVEKHPGAKRVFIAKKLGLPASTLNSIVRNREKILASKKASFSLSRKRIRRGKFSRLEAVLLHWFKKAQSSAVPIDGTVLREQATLLASNMGVNEFKASDGWVERFKHRHGIVYKQPSLKEPVVSDSIIQQWKEDLKNHLKDYDFKDIFNADETALFFKVFPNRIMHFKGEACHDGKYSDERLTILLCVNGDGSDKLPPLIIGKYLKPNSFNRVKSLPCKYDANRRAWMTEELFQKYLRFLDNEMRIQNRKILLLVDQCAVHPSDTSFLMNIKVAFFPEECTNRFQPLQQGVIKCLKQHYRERLVRRILNQKSKRDQSINELEALHYIAAAWEQIQSSTIVNSFAKAGIRSTVLNFSLDAREEEVEQQDLISTEEWLIVTEGATFEEYATCDDDVVVCEAQKPDENSSIMKKIKDEPPEEEKDDEVDEPLSAQVPKFNEAIAALETVRNFVTSFDVDEDTMKILTKMDNILFKLASKNRRKKTNNKS